MGDTSDTKDFGKYFTIAKISKQEYLQALKHRYYFLTNDNLRIEKQNGVIKIKLLHLKIQSNLKMMEMLKYTII